MEQNRGINRVNATEPSEAMGSRTARGSELHSIARRSALQPMLVRIDCPFPLLTAGLVNALEGTQLHYRRGPMAVGVPHILVLWAEDAESLAEDVRRVREVNPDASVLILGLRENMPLALAALRAGARGYLHAEMRPEQFARAISMASEGKVVAPRDLLEHLVSEAAPSGAATNHGTLRPRQLEILKLVAEGQSNAQIAKRLYLSESTVKQHLRVAYKLLGVKNRTAAAKSLIRDGDAR
jgi:DNA-binding NarL/FixJ family response regulator